MTNAPRRGAIYCRMSKAVKHIPKVEDQEAMCRELAARHGIEIAKVYVDDGISGARFLDRPGWQDLLTDANAGQFDVLLAQTESRFSRQVMEKETLQILCASKGITWLTLNEGALDPADPDDEFFSTMRAAMDRKDVKSRNKMQRQSNERARLRGEPARGGDRPFGYEADKKTIHEPEAKLVRWAYAGIVDGSLTPGKIARTFDADKVPTSRGGRWTHGQSVTAMLKNARYAGVLTHKGERVLGDDGKPVKPLWKPIVDEATYLAAMAVLNDPGRKLTKVHEAKYLCPSLVTCATCGEGLDGNPSARGIKYRCRSFRGVATSTGHVEITAAILDEAVSAAVVDAVIYAPRSALPDSDTSRMGELRTRLGAIGHAKANLLDLIDSEMFSAAEVAPKKRALDVEAEAIESEIASIRSNNAKAALLADVQDVLVGKASMAEIGDAKHEIRERFDAMPLEQRRALIAGMVEATVTAGGRGAKRVKVRHLVAVGLNDEPYVEEEHDAVSA